MGYSLWKFRRRGPSDLRDGDPTHGNTLLEISWTAVPLLIVAVFGIWGAKIARRQRGARRERPRDHGHRLQLRLRVPLRQRRRLHAQRRALRAGRRADHAAHDHAAVHARHEEPRGHPRLLGAGVGGQAGRDAGRQRQDGRHDLRQAHAHRHLRGAVHRAVRLRPRRDALQEHPRALAGATSPSGSTAPRPRRPRPSRRRRKTPGLAVFNSAGCGGCHTFTPAKSSGKTGPSLDDVSAGLHAREGGRARPRPPTSRASSRSRSSTRTPTSPRASRRTSCPRTSARA